MKKQILILTIALISIFKINAQEGNATNGLFVDALIGVSSFSSHTYKGRDGVAKFSLNARVGNKMYLSNSNKLSHGVQMTWVRLGVSTFTRKIYGTIVNFTSFDMMPLNIGYTGYLKFNENIGLETNFNVGPGFSFNKHFTLIGLHLNPEFKLRYNALAVGLDFSFFNGKNVNEESYSLGYWFTLNTYSLVLGVKF